MADFVQSANVKSAVRTLAESIADVATYGHDRPVGMFHPIPHTASSTAASLSCTLMHASRSSTDSSTQYSIRV